jgi:PA domain/Secretion system C-terminal sorting domain/Calx-beta domain
MKKITLKLLFLFLFFMTSVSYSQKVAIIGINHATTDGFTFVVTQDLSNGEVIYFTENEYNDASNAFVDATESVVIFTATSVIPKGNVVFVNELATPNTFSVSCTTGGCGTALISGAGPFALATDGETLYAYTDSDANPTNGITTIYSVMYTGSGETVPPVNGGFIPAAQDPSFDFPTAIVVDGFPAAQPNRVEFTPTTPARTNVTKVGLENPSNYVHAQANAALSTLFFTNFNLLGANPTLTLTASPASVNENSGTGMVYTFLLSANATSNLTINFTVGGTATFSSDYTQSGAATFNATSGTVTIANGTNTASVTLTPIGDTTLEANETITVTAIAGTGYDAGSPSAATTTINNDDTLTITPVVAITGINHSATQDGFSFVALQNLTAGTVIYFTENAFDKSTLTFSGAEGVMQWTVPAGGLARGQVVVATETSANVFTTTCSSGGCGNVTLVSGTFTLATTGEELYAYLDADSDPTNGVTSVQAVLYTGTSTTSGGVIPSIQDPGTVYPGAVVVDGFPAVSPLRTEYDSALRGVTVDRANFQNPSNWLNAQSNSTLSTVPFANIIISTGAANPFASVTVSPATVVENSGTPMVYTFALSSPATSNITVNFSVSGSATFTSDYTASGASSFTATTGSVVIPNGASSATVSITPVGDTTLEVQETVVLTITSGTNYDGGSPNAATGSITNDDTSASNPMVALVGISQATTDGFSFVAVNDIPAASVVYFTDKSFNNLTLLFGAGEAVLRWTSPGSIITKGNVIVITESAPDTFTVTCSNGTCGSITLISGNLALATLGESLYCYKDNDTDPTNGVTDIYAVLYTGNSTTSGGNIPSLEDPSTIYLNALVVDGFPATAPARTEYDSTKRGVLVTSVNFEDISNWVNGQSSPALSTVPFANLNLVDTTPPTAVCQNISVTPNVGTDSVTITASQIDNGSTDNVGIVSYSIDVTTFTCANVGTPVSVTLTVTDAAGNSATCPATVIVLPNTTSTFTQVAPICAGGSFTLPTTSINGFTGAWSPAIDNTTTTTYTFTPDAGQCGSSTTMTVVVNPNGTPTFTAVADICSGAALTALPTTSNNGYTGTWAPALDNTTTTTYTFTPNAGQCATTATLTIVVKPNPTVNAVGNQTLCNGATTTATTFNGTPLPIPQVYTVSPFTNKIYTIPTNTYQATTEVTATLTGFTVLGINSISYDPSTSQYYVVVKVGTGATPRRLGTLNPITGVITDIGSLGDRFSGLTFSTTGNLWGVTGNGATCSECLYTINKATATPTFIRTLGLGADGEVILFNPADGFLYHWSGNSTVEFEKLDTTLYNGTPIGTYTSGVGSGEVFGASIDPLTGDFIVNDISSNVERWTLTGPVSSLGVTKDIAGIDTDVRGFVVAPGLNASIYNWTNNNPSIGLAASGTGNIPSFTATNTSASAVTATITVTPSLNGCTGTPVQYTITVNPTITPTFTAVASICTGGSLSALPTTSNNGITGTWAPALDNTTTTTYTFTPDAGQCATTATLTITVNPILTPTFTAVAPICSGATLAALPTTSNNGVSGTWAPALVNTATTTYTFTPGAGQCATTTTMTIVVNPNPIVTFTANPFPVCAGTSTVLSANTSNITPTVNFTDLSAVNQSLSIIPAAFGIPVTSPLSGTLALAPSDGCAAFAPGLFTGKIALIQRGTCSFIIKAQNAINAGAIGVIFYNNVAGNLNVGGTSGTATIPIYGTTQANGLALIAAMTANEVAVTLAPSPTLTYVWSNGSLTQTTNTGVLNVNTDFSVTVTNPATGCSTLQIVTVPVTANTIPTFTQVAAICTGGTLAPLPTTSNNGIAGTWAPALDNTATTTYTFTPTPVTGQCLGTATMTITVNQPSAPPFTQVAPICNGAVLAALPTTANNGVTGTWAPAIDNTVTTTYTFTPDAGQCATTTTMTIVVNPNPIVTFTANPFPVCAGTSTVLSANTSNITPTVNFTNLSAVNQSLNMIPGAFGTPVSSPLAAQLVNTGTIGCTAFTPGSLTGKIALIQRGTCSFAIKAQNAQAAGAIGVLIYNNAAGNLNIGGAAPTVTIPVYGITQADGLALIAAMTANEVPVTLTPAPPLTYVWSNGSVTQTTNTGVLNVDTDFSVTVTNTATGCSTLQTITVPVTANTIPTFTQVAAICSGDTLAPLPTTSDNGVVGTWAPALDNTTTTTYTFTPTPVTGQCLGTATMTITVNPLTTNGSVTTTVCSSYTWPANGVTYTTSQTGITVVTGCNTATLNLTITGNPIDYANLQFPSTQVICEGQSFTAYGRVYEPGITDASQTLQGAGIDVEYGYNTANTDPATWTNWSTASYNAASICYPCNDDEYEFTTGSSLAAGTYYFTFRYKRSECTTWQYGGYPNGFWNGTTQNSGVLTVNSAPTPTGNSVQTINVVNANDATIASIVVSPTGVIWYASLLDAQNATNPLLSTTALTDGATYYAVNQAGSCTSTPFAVTVTVTLNTDGFDNLNFSFYPNPTSSLLNITYSKEISEVSVSNLLGQLLLTKKTNATEVQIDLSRLAEATYFVKVVADGKEKVIKVIKRN